MADISVEATNWGKLKRATNAFVPALVERANGDVHDFTAADLYRAGQRLPDDNKGLSQHLCGKVLGLSPVSHTKAQQIIKAYGELDAAIVGFHGALTDDHIVIAVLAVADLQKMAGEAGLQDAAAIAGASGVSLGAVNHALQKGRITGGIAHALYAALSQAGANVPPLEQFATSSHLATVAEKSIKGSPFTLADLALPLPTPTPDPWP